jgi:hypothetical protein
MYVKLKRVVGGLRHLEAASGPAVATTLSEPFDVTSLSLVRELVAWSAQLSDGLEMRKDTSWPDASARVISLTGVSASGQSLHEIIVLVEETGWATGSLLLAEEVKAIAIVTPPANLGHIVDSVKVGAFHLDDALRGGPIKWEHDVQVLAEIPHLLGASEVAKSNVVPVSATAEVGRVSTGSVVNYGVVAVHLDA